MGRRSTLPPQNEVKAQRSWREGAVCALPRLRPFCCSAGSLERGPHGCARVHRWGTDPQRPGQALPTAVEHSRALSGVSTTGRTDGRTGGRTDGRTDVRTDGRTGGRTGDRRADAEARAARGPPMRHRDRHGDRSVLRTPWAQSLSSCFCICYFDFA